MSYIKTLIIEFGTPDKIQELLINYPELENLIIINLDLLDDIKKQLNNLPITLEYLCIGRILKGNLKENFEFDYLENIKLPFGCLLTRYVEYMGISGLYKFEFKYLNNIHNFDFETEFISVDFTKNKNFKIEKRNKYYNIYW